MDGQFFDYNNPALIDYECEGQIDIFDLFGVADAIELQKKEKLNDFLSNVELCNFVSIEDKDESALTCRCDGELVDSNSIQLICKEASVVKHFTVSGRVCKDCSRKYIFKEQLIEYYNGNIKE